jgi:predicted hydrolase (HD superfamily)
MAGIAILRQLSWPEEIIVAIQGQRALLGRASHNADGQSALAVDELTGFVAACALVRPDKSIANLTVKSVKNKWKDKAFARAVNRQDIEQGAANWAYCSKTTSALSSRR